MSLLLILGKLWRYKLATLPVLGLILAGAFYVMAVTAPTYEASSTYILVSPPAPPTDDEIARNPALGKIHADNPYLRYGDQSVVVQLLASRLNSEEGRRSLAAQGVGPQYTIAPSPAFGFSAPLLQITSMGSSPAAAIRTAGQVGRAVTGELGRMQALRGVDPKYRIKTEAVVVARDATLRASGKLRALVAVLALGAVLLFIVVSVLDALRALRAQWRQGASTGDGVAQSLELPPDEHSDAEASFAFRGPVEPLRRDPHFPSAADRDPKTPEWLREAQ
jgi:hypothetical protein